MRILKVFVASPGDVLSERSLLPEVIERVNKRSAQPSGITLILWRWETDAVPGFGEPQTLINPAVDDADIVIVILWSRLGSPTPRAESGTAEELQRAYDRWQTTKKPRVLLYHCKRDLPQDRLDLDQLGRLRAFLQQLRPIALLAEYREVKEFEQTAETHLHSVVREFVQQPSLLNSDRPPIGPAEPANALLSLELATGPSQVNDHGRMRTFRVKLGSLSLFQISWLIALVLVIAGVTAVLWDENSRGDDWKPGRWIASAEYRGALAGPPGKLLRQGTPEQRKLAWFLLGVSDGELDNVKTDPSNSARLQGELLGTSYVRPEERRAEQLENELRRLAGGDMVSLSGWFHLGQHAGRIASDVKSQPEPDIPSANDTRLLRCLSPEGSEWPCPDREECRRLIRLADTCFQSTLEATQ